MSLGCSLCDGVEFLNPSQNTLRHEQKFLFENT